MEKNYFYIAKDGAQIGPRTLEELRQAPLEPETLVWYEGLPDWTRAGEIGELNALINGQESVTPPPAPVPCADAPKTEPAPEQPPFPKPKNWLVESILLTIFCCLPFGIVSIVYATKVDNLWYLKQYVEAERASRNAKTFFWWGLALSLGGGLIYLMLIIAGALASTLPFSGMSLL